VLGEAAQGFMRAAHAMASEGLYRCNFFVREATKSPGTKEALDRIVEVYAIEDKTRSPLLPSG
jgi:hypothetical protein